MAYRNTIFNTWLPTITGSTTNPTVNYTTQLGKYSVFGNQAFIKGHIVINTISGGSGNLTISLPFGCVNTSVNVISCYLSNITFVASTCEYNGIPTPGTSVFVLISPRSATTRTTMPVSALTSGSVIVFSGFYYILPAST